MRSFAARRLLPGCILAAATVAALAAPGAASAAEFVLKPCEGVPIEGNGSSLQKLAQQTIWNPDFNTSSVGCSEEGKKPTVKYISTGSGPGLESWGVELGKGKGKFGPSNAYIAGELPPTTKQKEEIEENGAKGTLETIPVQQAAVTVSVHLPKECTATSTSAPGRLVLKNKTVEEIFEGKIQEWGKIKDGGDKFEGAGCTSKGKVEKGLHIKRVVRLEGSGTTGTFMKYMYLSNKKPVEGTKTWFEVGSEANNIVWPNEATDPVVKGKGNGGVAAAIAAEESSIGYVNLADARANGAFTPPTGGKGKGTFWVDVENQKTPTVTYTDPATNGDEAGLGDANCAGNTYTNGKKKFPPPSTLESWSEVNTSLTQVHYTICGFTYDMALTKYQPYPGTSEGEARTVFDYFSYMLNNTSPEGGQEQIHNHDYLGLPVSAEESLNVLKIAQKGAGEIRFE